MKKLRVETENEKRVFLESLNFEIEMRVSQKSAPQMKYEWSCGSHMKNPLILGILGQVWPSN